MLKMISNDSVQIFSDKYLENMVDVFRTIYTEEQLSDVTIHCKQGSIKAHKLILAANSPYFYRIFKENGKDNPIIILHGITLNQLRNLMDLLYYGKVDVLNSDMEALSALVREFEIKGVVFASDVSNNVRMELNQSMSSPDNAHYMDTRFRGQKRVAVDYDDGIDGQKKTPLCISVNNETRPAKRPNHQEALVVVKNEQLSPVPSEEMENSNVVKAIPQEKKPVMEITMPKLSAWAKKQRKFKCHLCPSSFKRSSHLSRHQLVHTGERPFACSQCDKAFSRHDKLKHHVRRAHEFIPDSMYEKIDSEEINTENEFESNNGDDHKPITKGRSDSRTDLTASQPAESFQRENSPLFTISHITSILEDSFVKPPKKGRGRPRKYPLVPTPNSPVKRGRGRPRLGQGAQNYDSTNLPYGDLNYLTRPSSTDEGPLIEDVFLEPLVEIKTEQNETSKKPSRSDIEMKSRKSYMERAFIEPIPESQSGRKENGETSTANNVDISEIETKIGLIGECTISVAN